MEKSKKVFKRQGSLLFDVILYIIAAAVVIASIYFGFSALKGQADVSTLTNNDTKVLMDTATSFRNGYYNSKGKYHNLSAASAKAWSTLKLVNDNGDEVDKAYYVSTKFDNECKYYIGAHDKNSIDSRYGILIDCSVAKTNQNWSDEKTYQVELAFANSIKARIPDAVIDGAATTGPGTETTNDSPDYKKWTETTSASEPNSDGIMYIYNLYE